MPYSRSYNNSLQSWYRVHNHVQVNKSIHILGDKRMREKSQNRPNCTEATSGGYTSPRHIE